jgi:hypothetical protein
MCVGNIASTEEKLSQKKKNLKVEDLFEDSGIDGRIILKLYLKKGGMWNGAIWLRAGTSSRFLWVL